MKSSRKLISIILVIAICFSTFVVSSLTSGAADKRTLAFAFAQDDYDKNLTNNDPTTCLCSNNGSVRIASDHNAQQYQVWFKVSDKNSERLAEAINEACEFYTGQLTVGVTVNSAKTIYGTNCRPTIQVDLFGKTKSGGIDHSNRIATTGANQQAVEIPVNYYLDVSRFGAEPYNYEIGYVYIQIQCYDWGCGGGKGTTPDVTIDPLFVDDGEEIPTSISTLPPDPNQSTFFKFSPDAKNDYNNGPGSIMYSADGGTWKRPGMATSEHHGYIQMTQHLNFVEQMQVSFNFNKYQDETINALNLANSDEGNGLLKVALTLVSCKDPYGNDCPAEVLVRLDTRAGELGDAPKVPIARSWQYPGTTRIYYIDVSNIVHFSQLNALAIQVQNYWYYSDKNELFDFDQESNYAGEEAGIEKGYKKCRIKPTVVVSPVTVVKEPGVTYENTPYNLVLNDFNKNGGVVPNPITLVDPNIPKPSSPTKSTSGGGSDTGNTTVATQPATPTLKSVALSAKKAAKVSWSKVERATGYEIFRAVGSNKAANFKYFKSVTANELSIVDTTLSGGKAYYYKVKAVNDSSGTALKSSLSTAKGVKLINYTAKPKIKVTAGSKRLTVKLTKKVTNATIYQVQYATSSKFKKAKTTTLTTKKTIKKLSKGKTYYVRVRARVKINGKYQYGAWSLKAKTKVK